ncbi:MAG: SUMF1/EgtB/PvdO family nonheme iron enzyme, partial [Anaerolineae bacterium]
PDLAAVEAGRSGMRAWEEKKGEIRLIQASQLARRKRLRQRWLVSSAFLALAAIVLVAANWDALKNSWLRYEALQASPQADMGTIEVDLYEVSIALYDRCHRAAPERCPAPEGSEAFIHFQEGLTQEYGDLPVTNVSGLTAAHYCQWLGRQLPSSADWEYAAGLVYKNQLNTAGAIIDPQGMNQDSEDVWPVDRGAAADASADQPLHLIGNVWEWTCSPGAGNRVGPCESSGDLAGTLVLRGGSYSTSIQELDDRQTWAADKGSPQIGFRCVAQPAQSATHISQ